MSRRSRAGQGSAAAVRSDARAAAIWIGGGRAAWRGRSASARTPRCRVPTVFRDRRGICSSVILRTAPAGRSPALALVGSPLGEFLERPHDERGDNVDQDVHSVISFGVVSVHASERKVISSTSSHDAVFTPSAARLSLRLRWSHLRIGQPRDRRTGRSVGLRWQSTPPLREGSRRAGRRG